MIKMIQDFKNGEIKIMECFFPFLEKSHTTKEIETISGYSHERVYNILMGLVKKGYLLKRKVGKTYLFSANLKKDLLLPFIHFQTKRKGKFLKFKSVFVKNLLDEFVEKITNDDLISITVFGSYAKGEERQESDIDLLCIVRKKYPIEKIALSLTHKYNRKITPVIVLARDSPNMKKDNPTFYEDLIKFGVILYGMEFFYRLTCGSYGSFKVR